MHSAYDCDFNYGSKGTEFEPGAERVFIDQSYIIIPQACTAGGFWTIMSKCV